VIETDTLRSIALKYFGDHLRWVDIVATNSLTPADFDLQAAGITDLFIPIAVGVGTTPGNPYLTDIAVDDNQGIVFSESGGIGVTTGIENVAAAVVRALTTNLEELLAHPEYGLDLDRYVGVAGTDLYLRFLKLEAGRVIRRDPRVSNVVNLKVTQNPGVRQIVITGNVQLVGGADTFDLTAKRSY
jgi:hypothetical protein